MMMNNSDMPAMPQSVIETMSGDMYSSEDCGGSGFTKREQMAMEFTKAYIIGVHSELSKSGDCHGWSCDDFASAGVEQANALLKALEES